MYSFLKKRQNINFLNKCHQEKRSTFPLLQLRQQKKMNRRGGQNLLSVWQRGNKRQTPLELNHHAKFRLRKSTIQAERENWIGWNFLTSSAIFSCCIYSLSCPPGMEETTPPAPPEMMARDGTIPNASPQEANLEGTCRQRLPFPGVRAGGDGEEGGASGARRWTQWGRLRQQRLAADGEADGGWSGKTPPLPPAPSFRASSPCPPVSQSSGEDGENLRLSFQAAVDWRLGRGQDLPAFPLQRGCLQHHLHLHYRWGPLLGEGTPRLRQSSPLRGTREGGAASDGGCLAAPSSSSQVLRVEQVSSGRGTEAGPAGRCWGRGVLLPPRAPRGFYGVLLGGLDSRSGVGRLWRECASLLRLTRFFPFRFYRLPFPLFFLLWLLLGVIGWGARWECLFWWQEARVVLSKTGACTQRWWSRKGGEFGDRALFSSLKAEALSLSPLAPREKEVRNAPR